VIDYFPVLLLMVIVAFMAAALLAITTFIGPKRTNPDKELPFETGNLPTPGNARAQFSVHYYLVAILFVVFDVEVAFLYPWAVQFKQLGLFGLIEMLVFLFILFIGWLFIIRRGVLEWK
jgi:NADH-quinone oxidoreductase subunit A